VRLKGIIPHNPLKFSFFVIPAKAGIYGESGLSQKADKSAFKRCISLTMDPGFRQDDV
jgi:hypothetical protein